MSGGRRTSALRRARSTVLTPATDLAALQTAAALEATAVLTYEALLALPVVAGGDATVRAALDAARDHHATHGAGFDAAAVAAGGAPQPLPEAGLLAAVRTRLPAVADSGGALAVALLVEQTLAATYVATAQAASTPALRAQYVATAAVESQHVAYLRTAAAAGADLAGDPLATRLTLPRVRSASEPQDLDRAVGSAGCHDAFAPATGAVAPSVGAVS